MNITFSHINPFTYEDVTPLCSIDAHTQMSHRSNSFLHILKHAQTHAHTHAHTHTREVVGEPECPWKHTHIHTNELFLSLFLRPYVSWYCSTRILIVSISLFPVPHSHSILHFYKFQKIYK